MTSTSTSWLKELKEKAILQKEIPKESSLTNMLRNYKVISFENTCMNLNGRVNSFTLE